MEKIKIIFFLKSNFKLALLFLIIICIVSCRQKPDFEVMHQDILDLHSELIEAHLKKDVNFFTRDISNHYFLVNDGKISYPSKQEINNKFTNYLNNTTFSEYRDLQEPVISFSKDGSMAWSLVRVKISGNRFVEKDSVWKMDFTCAWITLYEKQNDKWIRMGDVSNFK